VTEEYDPRARRLNPLIDELVTTLDEYWQFLLSTEDYLERKGRLRMVRQIIDQILAEPEWLDADLQDGAIDPTPCFFPPAEFADQPAPLFLDETPFDTPGYEQGRMFFYTDTGRMSFLYEGEPVVPRFDPVMRHGIWLHTLEKHYATAVETVNHAININLWKQLTPAHDGWSEEDAPRHFVICDPAGVVGGNHAQHVASYRDAARAVEVAEMLSSRVGIRFLVARERLKWSAR